MLDSMIEPPAPDERRSAAPSNEVPFPLQAVSIDIKDWWIPRSH
jgi:hypothetical protein